MHLGRFLHFSQKVIGMTLKSRFSQKLCWNIYTLQSGIWSKSIWRKSTLAFVACYFIVIFKVAVGPNLSRKRNLKQIITT